MPKKICAWTGCRTFIAQGKYCPKHSRQVWKQKNPDKVRAAQSAYRARKRNAPAVEPVSRAKVYKRDKGVCGICGKKASPLHFHVDHVVPLARGGPHTYGNTQVAHPSCNQKKGAR